MATQIITDNSPMPYGKYKGKKMGEVPDEYLLWLYTYSSPCDNPEDRVIAYIEENLDAIKANIDREKRDKKHIV